MSHVTYEWVMSCIYESCHISTSHVTYHTEFVPWDSSSCTTHTLSLFLFHTHIHTLSVSVCLSFSHTHTHTFSFLSLSHTHPSWRNNWMADSMSYETCFHNTNSSRCATHTHSFSHSHTHKYTHKHTHKHSLSFTHTHTHMHSLSLSYTHTPALTQCLDRRLNIIRNVFPQNKFIQACNILQLRVAIEQQCSMLRIR